MKKPLGFFVNRESGKIRNVIVDGAAQTHSFLAHQLPDMAMSVISPVILLVLFFYFDWRLGLASLMFVMRSVTISQFSYFATNAPNNIDSIMDYKDLTYGDKTDSKEGLTFNNVSFSYNEEKVLDNVSFSINKGETASSRIDIANRMKKLPLSYFGKRDLTDLATTMMGDITLYEEIFSHAVPHIYSTIISTTLISLMILSYNWKLGSMVGIYIYID